jgi:hypothetical protein
MTCVVTAALIAFAGMALAGQELGSATPQNPKGRWSVGAGYYYYEAKWKAKDADQLDLSEVKQNMIFGDVGYGFAENWEAYLKVGGADWSSLGALPVAPRGNVEADYKPFFSLGLRGSIYREHHFAFGFMGQYNWFSNYEVTQTGQTGVDVKEPYEATAKFRSLYDINLGVNFDYVPSWGVFYLGVFWYHGAGKADASVKVGDDPADTFASDIEENGYMGGLAGAKLLFGRGWNVNVEGQYKTKPSVSVSLNKVFGV